MDSRIFSKQMILSLKKHLHKNTIKYITYPNFVFLCGKYFEDSTYLNSNRGVIERYISKQADDVFIVLSEKLWEDEFNSNIDLLTFEEFLAEISDCIILLVESPGSFCELGAFSYADKLFSDKLLVVIDNKYCGDKSFIITGPAAKIKKDGSDVVYAPLDGSGLLSSHELREAILKRINSFRSKRVSNNKRKTNDNENSIFLNSFIIELLEIIKLTQPILREDLLDIYKIVKGFSSFTFIKRDGSRFNTEIKYNYILKLLHSVKLININNGYVSTDYYKRVQNLMFKYYNKAENVERNKLLCRKYRYKGSVSI